jgi:hypothetical protein
VIGGSAGAGRCPMPAATPGARTSQPKDDVAMSRTQLTGSVARSRWEDGAEVAQAEGLDEVGVRAAGQGVPSRCRVGVERADDDGQGREVVPERADGVQSLSNGELNLKDHGVRSQSVNRFERADWAVRIADHRHVVGLLYDVTHELTTIRAPVYHYHSHLEVETWAHTGVWRGGRRRR